MTERARRSALTLALALTLLASCGDQPNASGPTDSAVDTTPSVPTSSSLPVTHGYGYDFEEYGSLAELADVADLVAVGTVTEITSLGSIDSEEDPHASEYMRVVVQPTSIIKGTAPEEIVIAWEGFVTDGKGNRTLQIVMDGIALPKEREELVLFLLEETPDRIKLFGGDVTHYLVTRDGIGVLEDGRVARVREHGRTVSEEMLGLTPAEIESIIG